MKIKVYYLTSGKELHVFYCPGCRGTHTFDLSEWKFDGNWDLPTYTPSLMYPGCHLILRHGIIEYCKDCDHELRGQDVPLESF